MTHGIMKMFRKRTALRREGSKCTRTWKVYVFIVIISLLLYQEILPSPSSSVPKLTLKRCVHKPNVALPTDEIGVDYHALMHELDRVQLYQLILDPCLTPGLQNASAVAPRFSQVEWSPAGLLHYGRCLLATLTNMGAVKVEWMYNRKWWDAADVSACWLDRCRMQWSSTSQLGKEALVDVLCERAAQIKTVAMAWGELRGEPSSCHSMLATAQRDGVLLVWRIDMVRVSEPLPPRDPALLHVLESHRDPQGAGELVTALRWCGLGALGGEGLLVGNKDGVLRLWGVSEGRALYDLYGTPDRIQVTHIMDGEMHLGEGKRVIAVAKDNVLVAVLLGSEGQRLDMAVETFQDIALTGMITLNDTSLVVSTRSGKLHEVQCAVDGEAEGLKLKLHCQAIACSINYNHNSCFGIAASKHRMLWVAGTCVSKMYDHLLLRQPTIVSFFIMSNTEDAIPLLVGNPSKLLTKFWDCLEIIRIQCLKMGQRPPVDVGVEDLDSLTSYQLRLSLWLVAIALSVGSDQDSQASKHLSSLYHHTRQLLFARHSCERVERMLASVVSRGAMEDELNCLSLLRTWMLHFVETGAAKSHWPNAVARVNSILAGSQGLDELIKELCVICEAEVESTWAEAEQWLFATCAKGHSVSRCATSLLPCVVLPYYTCSTCGLPVHGSFVTETEPLCVFCDSILRPDETISLDFVRGGVSDRVVN